MSLALAFGRWDVDGLLEEMPYPLYLEWARFNSGRPLDPSYVIMRGLMGPSSDGHPEAVETAPGRIPGSAQFLSHFARRTTGARKNSSGRL